MCDEAESLNQTILSARGEHLDEWSQQRSLQMPQHISLIEATAFPSREHSGIAEKHFEKIFMFLSPYLSLSETHQIISQRDSRESVVEQLSGKH